MTREEAIATLTVYATELLNCWRGAPSEIITAHEACIAAMTRDQWQPIETAPKDGTPVDLWWIENDHQIQGRTVDAFWKDGAWHQTPDGKLTGITVTHWMLHRPPQATP